MTPALDTFERSLVAASRALHASAVGVSPDDVSADTGWRPPGRRVLRRWRSLGALAQAAVALVALSGCVGVAVAGYLLLAGAQARHLPAFECEIDGSDMAIVHAVTGSPIIDCATQWPSASGGREAAPRLAIWGVTGGQTLVAIARPLRLGAPRSDGGQRWARLPDTWTVALPIVALQDQLSNIDQPFTSLAGGCSYADADVAEVRSLLRADGLSGWKVQVEGSSGPVSHACLPTDASVLGATRTVLLTQSDTPNSQQPSSPQERTAVQNAIAAHNELLTLYREVNRRLSSTCTSVPAATRLWIRIAKAAGYRQSTLAWWRKVNQDSQAADDRHFTLYEQPASQRTGRCAHVLVMAEGGGTTDVYVARIRP